MLAAGEYEVRIILLQKKQMMANCWMLLLTIPLLVLSAQASEQQQKGVKSAAYISPKIVLRAGSVVNRSYDNIDFPRGHIAIKEFTAELVDEKGYAVPVTETFVHHTIVSRYYTPKDNNVDQTNSQKVRYFYSGSESRQIQGYLPGSYGIVVGNPADVPEGYEERWYSNVHVIDTRSVTSKIGCIECECAHYKVTSIKILKPPCCYDGAQCRLTEGSPSIKRSLYMRYTVKWVDWVDTIVPVRIYILDMFRDTVKKTAAASDLKRLGAKPGRQVGVSGQSGNEGIYTKKTSIVMTRGGYLVYGVGHQYPGGIGSTLHGENGEKICSSLPTYGKGSGAGYIVGMSSCYPQSGTVKISNGETVILETNYNSSLWHSGALGNFYIFLADQSSDSCKWKS